MEDLISMEWQFIESSLSLYFAIDCLLILNRCISCHSTVLIRMYFSERHRYIKQANLQVFLWFRHSANNNVSMVGFTMSKTCVRFSEKVIQTMGMEATVNILYGHI